MKFTKTQTVTLTLTLTAINTLIHSHACSHFSRRYIHVSDNKHSNTVMSSFFDVRPSCRMANICKAMHTTNKHSKLLGTWNPNPDERTA